MHCPATLDHHNGPFLFGERLAIFLMIQAATLSAMSTFGLLVYVTWKRRKGRRHQIGRYPAGHSKASGLSLLLSLVIADLIQAMSGMPSWIWMLKAEVIEGPSCTFQGAFMNVGTIAIALSSLSIAIHTFVVLVLRWRVTRFALRAMTASIWILTALIVITCSRGRSNYYGDTGYWCWITADHCTERFVGEYLWMWLAFFVMVGPYTFMSILMLRGTIEAQKEDNRDEARESRKMAYSMLFYPAVYLLCVAPVSIIRWYDWGTSSRKSLPPAATLSSYTIFCLSGFLNVILFCVTRPRLITGDTASVSSENDSEELAERPNQRHFTSNSAERVGANAAVVEDIAGLGEYQRRTSRSLRQPSTVPHIADPYSRAQSEGRLPD